MYARTYLHKNKAIFKSGSNSRHTASRIEEGQYGRLMRIGKENKGEIYLKKRVEDNWIVAG